MKMNINDVSKKISLTTTIAIAMLINAVSAHAYSICYDLSNLTEGTSYNQFDTIDFQDGTLEFLKLLNYDASPRNFGNVFVSGANIAGDAKPELFMNDARIKVTLYQPASKVTFHVAKNGNNNGEILNIGANTERVQLDGGYEDVDGLVLGTNDLGQVQFSVAPFSAHNGGNWYKGTVELNALTGSISNFSFGALNHRYDDFCITY